MDIRLPRARLHVAEQPLSFAAARAHLGARRLDRDLAAGVTPSCSQLHAVRALQLTSARQRATVATRLERLLLEARYPRLSHPRLGILLAPARGPVLGCDWLISDLAATLRAATPISAEVVARLRALLRWSSGALYACDAPGQLEAGLLQIADLIVIPGRGDVLAAHTNEGLPEGGYR
jgi:hypothetical protein